MDSATSCRASATRWRIVAEELLQIGAIAGPMVGATLMEYLMQTISVMIVGHTGTKLSLSAATLAFSSANLSGIDIQVGMSGGLETLGGQAYGAQQYQKLGILTYTAMFTQLLASFPMALLWIFMDKALLLLHQDPNIAREAGKFTKLLIPSLFANALFQPLARYFQIQCLIWPLLILMVAGFAIHIPLCWVLVYKTSLATDGAAIAYDISTWLFVIFLASFMMFSSRCEKTRPPFSSKMFSIMLSEMRPFVWLATFSALMVCLEYWAVDIIVLLTGLLKDPELETSVLALCLSIMAVLYTIPYGLSCGACTRVSNELGAGNAESVNIVIWTILSVSGIEGIAMASTLFATRHIFGYIFSKDKQVVDYSATITPLICCSVVLDGFLCTLTGVSRGCGMQKFVTVINIIAYYVVWIPASVLLCFKFNLKGKGLWGGILLGQALQLIALSLMMCCTNWNKQVNPFSYSKIFTDWYVALSLQSLPLLMLQAIRAQVRASRQEYRQILLDPSSLVEVAQVDA